MMAARQSHAALIDRLPRVRGGYDAMVDLGKLTWFRVGGPAEVLFTPADVVDLTDFLKTRPRDVAVTVIGLGSNLMVRDGGVPGVVIKLGKAFAAIEPDGYTLRCGAAAVDATVATAARDNAIAGLEFLTGIPGTVGGALRMNAGAYGREMQNICMSATAVDDLGEVRKLSSAELGFSYRHTSIPESWVFIGAELRGVKGDPEAITRRILEIRSERASSQPIHVRTGGSTFANPAEAKAWQLIDQAGCRGLTRGGAMVSDKHCNFLINTGGATAAEIEDLGEDVRRRVKTTSGIHLSWEIRRIGVRADDSRALAVGGGA